MKTRSFRFWQVNLRQQMFRTQTGAPNHAFANSQPAPYNTFLYGCRTVNDTLRGQNFDSTATRAKTSPPRGPLQIQGFRHARTNQAGRRRLPRPSLEN